MAQPNYPSFQPGYNPYDSYGSNYAYGSGFRRINGLEIIVVLLSILTLIGSYTWGLLSTNAENRDAQRRQDISQVVQGLQAYYKNTSGVPSERRYPVALCSADLNEVDFESTVRLALTGQQKAKEPHAYIKPEDYPRDKWGEYAADFTSRQVPFRCPQLIGGSGVKSYSDNYPSCVFSSTSGFRKCYLYTSSNNGDQYQIAYFSESSNKFIVFQQFREEQVKIVA